MKGIPTLPGSAYPLFAVPAEFMKVDAQLRDLGHPTWGAGRDVGHPTIVGEQKAKYNDIGDF
jgi:hypothetical protein